MGVRTNGCSVATHTAEYPINQICSSTDVPLTYFEDLTTNHNKMFIKIENTTTDQFCQMFLILNGDINNPIFVPNAQDGRFLGNGQFSIQVEDVRKIEIICHQPVSQPDGACTGILQIQKTFCICCP